ncbi:MAG: hypothetical protein ABL900_00560 [Burkholderiaceae bacterium]
MSSQTVSSSASKWSPAVDAMAWLHAPVRDSQLTLVASKAFAPRFARPPPTRHSLLDISPRLRI